MKKHIKYLISFLLSCFFFGLTAQNSLTKEWEMNYDDFNSINNLIINSSGELVIVGKGEFIDFNQDDIVCGIVDSNGNLTDVFPVIVNGSDDDVPCAIIQSPDGGYIIAGYIISNTKKLACVIKIFNTGEPEWDIILGENKFDIFYDLVLDKHDNILLTGEKDGQLFLVKLSLTGQLIWEKELPFGQQSRGISIALHPKQGYLVNGFETLKNGNQLIISHLGNEGETIWTKTIPNAKGTDLCVSPDGTIILAGIQYDKRKRTDALLACLNQDGQMLWKKEYGGSGMDEANAILSISDTTFFLTGSSTSHSRGARRNKGWLRKLDKLGNEIWDKAQYFGGKGEDVALTLTESPNGNIIVGGKTNTKTGGADKGWLLSFKGEKKNSTPIDFNKVEISEVSFIDTDSNKILEPLEEGFIMVNIKNKTNQLINGVELFLDTNKEVVNIGLQDKFIIKQLPANNVTTIKVPVFGHFDLKKEKYNINLQLTHANRKDAKFYNIEIPTQETPKPELIISKAIFSRKEAIPGQEIKLELAITNIGNRSAKEVKTRFSLPYKVNLQDNLIKELEDLTPGETKAVTYSILPETEFLGDSILINCQVLEKDRKNSIAETISIRVLRQLPQSTPIKKVKKEFLEIVWLSPNPDEIGSTELNWEKETVITKVKAISDKVLTVNHFSIYNNGESIENGAKSDIVKLSSIKKDSSNRFTYTFIHQIQLSKGENEIQVRVKNASSEAATTLLKINHNPIKPNLHLLAIGVPNNRLQFTQKDAIDFANSFKRQTDKLFNKTFLKILTQPEETSIQNLRVSIQDIENQYLVNQIQEKDVVIVFISSHGQAYDDRNDTSFRIHASDFRSLYPRQYSLDYETDILSVLDRINCKKLLFIDACHSGSIAFVENGAKSINPSDDLAEAIIDLTEANPGLRTIVSSSAGELSYEDATWQNGAFTKSILEAFNNQTTQQEGKYLIPDMDKDHILTLSELFVFLQQRVPFLVKTTKGKSQHPFMPNQQRIEHLPIFFLSN